MRLLVGYAFMLNYICLIDWVRLNLNSPNLNSNECVGIVFKNGKPFLSSPLSCFGPAHLSFLPLPFSSFLAAQKSHCRPSRLPLPGLARHLTFLFHSPTDRRGPPVRPSFFLLPCAPRTPQSPAAARVLRCALAHTPRASAPTYIRHPHPPGTLSSPSSRSRRPLAQTLAAAAAIGAPAELGAAAVSPFRHSIDADDRRRSFVST